MRTVFSLVGLTVILSCFFGFPGSTVFAADYVEGEIIVKFKDTTAIDLQQEATQALTMDRTLKGVVAAGGVERVETVQPPLKKSRTVRTFSQAKKTRGVFKIRLREKQKTLDAVRELKKSDKVEYAEPNYIYKASIIPNDPSFGAQWSLQSSTDHDIDAPEAWDVRRDTSTLSVCVVDSGVDYTHPDLASNIWSNPGEIAGNGIDDEGNGYIDDIRGWHFFYTGTTWGEDNNPMDDHTAGHGTHVAGIISARGNNGRGVSGVTWNTKIIPVKVLDENGAGPLLDVVLGIYYALDTGCRVINLSLGGPDYSQYMYDAIAAARDKGVLVVAAAGNGDPLEDILDNEIQPQYPASYDLDNIVSVAATDLNDQLASFSHYGHSSVDLAAPGASIYSTVRQDNYDYLSGTSMAAPHVSGAAILAIAAYPGESYSQIRARLLQATDPITQNKTVTDGRLNLYKLVQSVAPTATMTPTATSTPSPTTSPAPTPVPGDANGNGHVDIFDYNTVISHFGSAGTLSLSEGNFDSDSDVDIFDYNVVISNFGR